MEFTDVMSLLGGLALFFFGMKTMSDGLEDVAGHKLEYILEKLTNHKLKAVLVGMAVTCLLQSSSAVTVMLIGFVNAKLMSLDRAAWVIMGANIGTTITGQIIALNVGAIAPIFAFVGVALLVFAPSKKLKHVGTIVGGFGILFIGLDMMSLAMKPLQDSAFFLEIMTTLSNPFAAILFGALFTALVQSSSATMGILQTLAFSGLISYEAAAYVIFGLNIGTCITAFLASLSGGRNAKRLALFHVLFNVVGTVLFLVLTQVTPIMSVVKDFTPNNVMAQLANMHTLFNLGTTLCLLFIDKYIIALVKIIIPTKQEEELMMNNVDIASCNLSQESV